MKYLLAGSMVLAALPVQAESLDCGVLANSYGAEPAGYAAQCLGRAGKRQGLFPYLPELLSGEFSRGYAAQLNPTDGFSEQGLYQFGLDDFAAAERIGTAADTVNMFGLDFNVGATRLYGAQVLANGVGTRLGTFDVGTGVFSPLLFLRIGDFQFADDVTGLAVHPRTGRTWVSTTRILTNNPQLSESRLWNLNLATGNASLIGRMSPDDLNPVFIDIAVNCAGEMYGHNISDDALYRIDPETAEATLVGPHGMSANFAQGMAFDHADGELYAWLYTGAGENTFGRFDLETGAFTALSEGPVGQWEGAIDSQCEVTTIQPETLTGAWYAPYTDGQGFTARYYPESSTLFMPWFTFSREGGDEPNQQRWYTLFGTVEEGATQIELPILQTLGGRFDAPPVVAPIQVGTATLSFYSCSQGVLDYQFDPEHNGGVQGRLTMTRLLRPGEECTQFDGSVVPADADYDSALSGSWYDPETSGQGLEIFRVARDEGDEDTNEDDEPGFLYGAWFTFEPEPEESGPDTQRWFTLSGQTVEDDGEIRTTIAQTIGGSFDDEVANPAARIGQAFLTSESCDTLKLRYEFDDIEGADEFQALEGEIIFRRLGACQEDE